MKSHTVVIIAHRLSTIQNATNILVLDHGKIIEQGNHEQLLDRHGWYRRLYEGDLPLENEQPVGAA